MCDFQVINTNFFGCVAKCTGCEHLHLGFGNVISAFEQDEFLRFAAHIEKLHKAKYADLLLSGEKTYLNSDSDKFAIVLSPGELDELNTLLSETRIMLQVYNILD